ncbi:MAG: dihydroorotase [Firmicutes bacterium]|nr:dihydroorotase [Bacillota bacterium]
MKTKNGMWVVPGLVDIHVHFRDPGLTHKEDIESGLKSAVRGGFTTVCTMPNTLPTIDTPELIKYQIEKAKNLGIAKLLPVSAMTFGLNGEKIVDMEANLKAGAIAFSDDGKSVMAPKVLEEIFKRAAKLKCLLMVHCEDLGLGTGNDSEWTVVKRDVELAIKHKTRLHICHVSTKESVAIIREAKKKHPNLITCEVSPHHIALTNKDVKSTNFKMAPPLRSSEDRLAVIEALKDGTIDAIATDHAPHSPEEKSVEFDKAPNGVIGLETAVGVVLEVLFHQNKFTLEKIVELMCYNPAKIIGVKPVGEITIDPNAKWVVPKTFESKSVNSPFVGMELRGKVVEVNFEK